MLPTRVLLACAVLACFAPAQARILHQVCWGTSTRWGLAAMLEDLACATCCFGTA